MSHGPLLVIIEIPVFNANSVDQDQMLSSAMSDLGLHCLPVALLGVSRLKWVKCFVVYLYFLYIFISISFTTSAQNL